MYCKSSGTKVSADDVGAVAQQYKLICRSSGTKASADDAGAVAQKHQLMMQEQWHNSIS